MKTADRATEEAGRNVAEAVAKEAEIEILHQVDDLCFNVLIPALEGYIKGLVEVNRFFAETEYFFAKVVCIIKTESFCAS